MGWNPALCKQDKQYGRWMDDPLGRVYWWWSGITTLSRPAQVSWKKSRNIFLKRTFTPIAPVYNTETVYICSIESLHNTEQYRSCVAPLQFRCSATRRRCCTPRSLFSALHAFCSVCVSEFKLAWCFWGGFSSFTHTPVFLLSFRAFLCLLSSVQISCETQERQKVQLFLNQPGDMDMKKRIHLELRNRTPSDVSAFFTFTSLSALSSSSYWF